MFLVFKFFRLVFADSPFHGCGGAFDLVSLFKIVGKLMGCVQSRELGARASPSEVYPTGKL